MVKLVGKAASRKSVTRNKAAMWIHIFVSFDAEVYNDGKSTETAQKLRNKLKEDVKRRNSLDES